jgi:hypothetical protein
VNNPVSAAFERAQKGWKYRGRRLLDVVEQHKFRHDWLRRASRRADNASTNIFG